jgi:hypothetical protein
MLPMGLMTTNNEREDFNKSLLNVSDISKFLPKVVANSTIDLLRVVLLDKT